jgi:prophage tail gpP-like protein
MTNARVQLGFSDGSTLAEWQSVVLRDSFADPVGEFSLSSAPITDGGVLAFYRDRLKKGELVSLRVNDVPQYVGLVQTIEKSISPDGGVVFTVSGGTPLLTPYEGAAVEDPNDYTKELSFHSEQSDVPVRDVILRAMRPYGFTELVGDDGAHVDLTSGKKRRKKGRLSLDGLTQRDAIAHPGETAYGLCARLLTRLGCCLKVRWDGVLYVTRPDHDQEISYTVGQSESESFGGDRFFGEVSIRDTNEGQFSECCVRGQAAENTEATTTSRPVGLVRSSDVNADRPPYRSDVAVYKPKVIKDKSARDLSRANSVGKLVLGMAARSAFVVSGNVDGWVSRTGRIWTVNTLARVVVEKDEIDETMFLLSRTLIQDPNAGQFARLEFVPKGYVVLGDPPGGD